MAAGGSIIKKPGQHNSNTELLNSLRENYKAAIEMSSDVQAEGEDKTEFSVESWTARVGDKQTLLVPGVSPYSEVLTEASEEYDITVKLFYLPDTPAVERCENTRAALQHVFKELGISSVSLLIVAFPNIHFDADDEDDEAPVEAAEKADPDFLQTYRTLETLVDEGLVEQIGLSEFGTARLAQVLEVARIKPSVDQINVRDCCVVPVPLIQYAKEKGIKLLTHDDCYDVLSKDSLEGLLGEFAITEKVKPVWVIKYTAVVRDRGVVENKGYGTHSRRRGALLIGDLVTLHWEKSSKQFHFSSHGRSEDLIEIITHELTP